MKKIAKIIILILVIIMCGITIWFLTNPQIANDLDTVSEYTQAETKRG